MATRRLFVVGKGQRRTVKCIAYPNRRHPRRFKPKAAGNIVCRILRDAGKAGVAGVDLVTLRRDLRQELDRCLPCSEDGDPQKQLQSAAAQAVAALQQTAIVIAVAIAALAALFLLARAVPFLPRVALALVPLVARRAITQIPVLLARLRAQQAANDSAWRRIVGL